MSDSIHQRDYRENPAACPHIKQLGLRRDILFELADTKLCRLMHSCSKCRSRINMKNFLVPVLWADLLPRWYHQQVINIELVKKLLPVVNPVNILRLGDHN